MKKTIKQILRNTVVAMLVISALQVNILVPPVKAVTQAEIDALKGDAGDLKTEKNELKAQINALKGDKTRALEAKGLLDRQSDVIRAEITNVEAQIAAYETLIAQTQAELEETEQKEVVQQERFRRCVREMEEGGTVSYWSVLFNASDFDDLLSRLDAANEVIEYRRGVIDTLRRLQQEISDKKAELEAQLAEQEVAKEELVARKAELDAQLEEATALIRDIQADQDAAEALMEEYDAEYERIQAQIKEMERELAASLGPATVGGYIWPETASKRITSPYGTRWHPVHQRWKTHNGVDIGGVGYTTPVLATKAGVVIISQKSSSYGHYVVVSHGTGNTTLYAHMSSRSVSVGDRVNQGQKIGVTGSTGISTGPHLHYEITENGSRVDPLQYLPGYIQAW